MQQNGGYNKKWRYYEMDEKSEILKSIIIVDDLNNVNGNSNNEFIFSTSNATYFSNNKNNYDPVLLIEVPITYFWIQKNNIIYAISHNENFIQVKL